MAKTMLDNLKMSIANTMTSDIKMIDVDKLHSSEDNYFELNRIEELADTILGQGSVKENLIVTPLPEGNYEIISGHRRAAAVRLLLQRGEKIPKSVPCLIQDYSNNDDKVLNLILMNVTARRLSDAELWTSYEKVDAILKKKKEAGEKFGRIRDTLAGYLGVSSSQIGKLQNIEKYATDKVKEAVSNGSISISTANQIARLDEKEQEAIVDTQDVSKIKTKDVKDQIDNSKKVDTSVKISATPNSEKVDTSVKIPTVSKTEKVDKLVIKEVYQDLLDRITERYNAEVQANYHDGLLDYVPKDKTSSEMLEIILCKYALENYQDLLRSAE
jgi:ParB-like chromosome segregation protein Spo0J